MFSSSRVIAEDQRSKNSHQDGRTREKVCSSRRFKLRVVETLNQKKDEKDFIRRKERGSLREATMMTETDPIGERATTAFYNFSATFGHILTGKESLVMLLLLKAGDHGSRKFFVVLFLYYFLFESRVHRIVLWLFSGVKSVLSNCVFFTLLFFSRV
jgi:hypothetical protein